MLKIIVIVSCKGGVGKSIFCVNFVVVVRDVIIFDCDD